MKIFILSLLFLSACSIQNASTNINGVRIEDTPWYLVGQSEAYFLMNSETKTINASAGCNQMGGSYSLKNTAFSLKQLAQTEMFCQGRMEAEEQLSQILQKANRITATENSLELFEGTTLLGRFTQQSSPIINKRWVLRSLNGNTIPQGDDVTLNFRSDNIKVDGNAGCNTYFGTYSSTQNQLEISGIGSTRMFCQERMTLEQNFLSMLKEVNRYQATESKLTLFKDQNPLATLEAVWLN